MGESTPCATGESTRIQFTKENNSTDGTESPVAETSIDGLHNEWSYTDDGNPLPADFIPGPYDVICQRGKLAHSHDGNRHFRTRIREFLPRYSQAIHKWEKTGIVTTLVQMIKELSPSGGFVRKIGSKWHVVGDQVAREKVGQTLRDQLHDKYRSSTKSKARKKRGDADFISKFKSIPDQRTQHGLKGTKSGAGHLSQSLKRPLTLSALSEELTSNDPDDGRFGITQQRRRNSESESDKSSASPIGGEHLGTQRPQRDTEGSYPNHIAPSQFMTNPFQNTNPRDSYYKMKQIETDIGAALDALFPPPDVDALAQLSVAGFESLLLAGDT